MKIRTRFALSSAVFVVLLGVLSLLMLMTYRKADSLRHQMDLAVRIEREAGNLAYLCSDYLIFQEGQQLRRLKSDFDYLSGDVALLRLEDPRLKAGAARILAGLAGFERILGEVTAVRQDQMDPEWFRARWSRAAAQDQEIIFQAEQLLLMIKDEVRRLDGESERLGFLAALVFAAYILLGYLQVHRLLKPIDDLQHGAAVIGSGNLEFRIEESGRDELAELARGFNRMTASLRDITASKGELEKEIGERKRADEQLRRKQAEVQALFDSTPAGLVLFDARPPYTVLVHNRYYQELFAEPFRSRGMVGSNLYDYAPGVEAAGVVAVFDEVVRTKQAKSLLDFPYNSNPPKESWFNWHITPIILDGKAVALVSMSIDVTDRHKAEEAARESEERLALALDAAGQGAWDYDIVTDTVTASPRMAEIYGLPGAGSLRTRADWRRPVFEEDLPAVDEAIDGAYRGKDRYEVEYRVRRQTDGAIRWIAAHGRVLRDSQGRPARLVGVVSDITDRKLAEEALRRLAQFPEENPNPVFRFSADGSLMYANGPGAALLATVWDWRAGSALPSALMGVAFSAYHKDHHVEQELSGLAGRTLWVSAARPKGEEYVNVYVRDVTERKRAEEALRASRLAALNLMEDAVEARRQIEAANRAVGQSEERLARAQGIAHLGSWELDLVKNRFNWSDEVYRIFGLAPQEFGATFEDFLEVVHPDDRANVDAGYFGSIREGRDTHEVEHRIVRKSTGEVRVVHQRCLHVRDEAGKIVKTLGTVHDITERKQADEEMRRLVENMEQFAYVASHDLQEPLRVIASYSQLLERRYKDKLDQDAADFIAFIVDGATRMQKLILDLLTYSRIGHRESALANVDCGSLVHRVISSMAETVESCGAEIAIDSLPVVKGHESSLTQLFQNLISNALKFRGDAAPKVEIRARKQGNAWLFSVRDNGIGIDPRYHDRIFAVFQRLHPRAKYSGTGIGLAICKKVVENHGGTIWVESEPGEGSTFYFKIPAGGKLSGRA